MNNLVIDGESPPDAVIADAEMIAEKTVARSVTVEDAVDFNWFIRVEGNSSQFSETEFYDFVDTIELVTSDEYDDISGYYEIGSGETEYLVRIEYVS